MSPEPEPTESRSNEETNNDESSMVPVVEVSVTSSSETRNSKRTESKATCNSNSSTSSHSSRSKDWTEATQPPSGSITTCSGSSSSEQNPDDNDDDDDQQSVSSFHSTNTHAMDISETSADMDGSPPALALTTDQDEDQEQQKSSSEQDQDEQDQDQNQDKSDRHKESSSEEERKIVTFQASATDDEQQEVEVEELQLVAYDPNSQPSHKRRPSTGTIRRSDLSSTSQHLGHFHKPLDPQEEERRRNEVSAAMEILEHMRRANLVMEFGPGVDLHACVFCLREERKRQHNNNDNSNNNTHPTCHKKPKPTLQDFLLPKFKPRNKECLICHTPVCKQHWDSGFYFQQNVILCQDCAPLFDLDNLIECMNLNNNNNNTTNKTNKTNKTNSNETSLVVAQQQQQQQIQKAQQEQHMRQLLIVYDRALLALRHSSQSFDDNARRRLAQTNWHKEGLGIGSSVTNIASGVTGIAATAVFMTPWGSWLLLTSLALGGIATAVGSGSFLVERLCPQTRQAEQTIALASMVDSLLEATAILRQARIAGALPPASFDESEHDDYDDDEDFDDDASIQSVRSLPRLPPVPISTADSSSDATTLFLQEDKEQQLMITILKAKMDAETRRARNPLQSAMKRINKQVKDHQRKHPRLRRLNRRNKNDSTTFGSSNNDGGEGENAGEEAGPLKRVACRVRKEVTRAKKKTGEAVVVAKTATALAAVGMSEGGVGFIRRFGGKPRGAPVAKSSPSTSAPAEKDDTESKTAETKCEATGEGTHSDQTGGNDKKTDDKTNATSAKKQPQQRRVSFRDEMTAARQGIQFFTRNLFNVGSMGNGDDENKKQQKNSDDSVVVRQPSFKTVRFPFKDVLVRVFLVRGSTNPATNDLASSNERALVAKIRNKNMDLKLRASDRVMQAFTRTNVKVAKQDVKRDRRQRLMASGESDGEQAPSNQVFVKNARFLVKASLTVLRETARYAGGAFSAAIVCVETMELQEKVKRIRGRGLRSANAEKLEQLKHHLWENQGSFPDTTTLEWELSGNAKGEIVEIFDGDGNSSIPHWSSSYEGQRPDGSCANLPIMEDSLSIPAYGYTMELSTPYHLH
ncbi:expressed unknown protein [Seminavis robusta]|uniref:Uncharacterized protein n=1 Tax=Seminavis robusta TaxID=568900 RepID=A0A9N8HIH5_9STRA|nr:expressed unknown protein [Seminavis robusta]|eukprot:Sro623_g177200.1 n/a (1089) ;mRNA; f:46536-49802